MFSLVTRYGWTVLLIIAFAAALNEEWCGDLGCYMEKVQVNFPNTTVLINEHGLTARFESFVCSKFSVSSVSSSASGNETGSVLSVSFRPALTCNGTVQLESNGEVHGGLFRATVSPSTSVNATIQLLTAPKVKKESDCVVTGVPDEFVMEHCEIHVRLAELKLVADNPEHQQFMDELLNATQEAVEGAGGIIACTELAKLLETNATSLLREFGEDVILPFSDCPSVHRRFTEHSEHIEQAERRNSNSMPRSNVTTVRRDHALPVTDPMLSFEQRSIKQLRSQQNTVGRPRSPQSIRSSHLAFSSHAARKSHWTSGVTSGRGASRNAVPDTLVPLSEVPILDAVGYIFNALLGKNGTLPLHDILSLFLDATGEVAIERIRPFAVNERAVVAISHLRVKGVETLNLPLFRSITETTIDSAIELGTLRLSGDVATTLRLPSVITLSAQSASSVACGRTVCDTGNVGAADGHAPATAAPPDGSIMLNETISLRTGVQNVFVDAVAQMFLDSRKLDDMNQEKAKEPECLIGLVGQDSCVLSFDGSAEFTEFCASTSNETSLESELLQVVNDGAVFARPFNKHLGAVIRYALETQVKPAVNAEIARALGRPHECPDVFPKHEILINIPVTLLASLLCSAVFLAIVVFYVFVSKYDNGKCSVEQASDERVGLLTGQRSETALQSSTTERANKNGEAVQHQEGCLVSGPVAEGRANDVPSSAPSLRQCRKVDSALLFDKELSILLRLGIPLLGLFVVVLFVSSNVSYAASVIPALYPREERQEDPITLPSMFNFNLKNSVVDMWNAGVYPLSILVLVFSGAWPYIKVVLFLFAWVVPPRVLPTRKRGQLLIALDALGKWSLIDSFMMVSMVVAFHFRVEFPHYLAGVHDHFVAGIIVEVCYGMSSFLCATLLSLVLIHGALACHRKVTDPVMDDGDTNRISVVGFYVRASKNKRAALAVGVAVALVLFVTLLVLVAGIFVYSFQFQFLGAAGLLLELFDISTRQPYSVYSLVTSMPLFAPSGTLPAVYFVATAFVLTIAVFPVVHIVLTAFLWLVPLRRRQQRALNVAVEVLNAWSAIEVYTLIILVELLEIRQFAGFIVEDTCRDITPLLERYFTPLLGEGNTKCFDVTATLMPGVWLFLAAAILYVATTMYTMAVGRKVFAQRLRSEVAVHRRRSVN